MTRKIKHEPAYGYITEDYIKKYIKEKEIKMDNISLYASDNKYDPSFLL